MLSKEALRSRVSEMHAYLQPVGVDIIADDTLDKKIREARETLKNLLSQKALSSSTADTLSAEWVEALAMKWIGLKGIYQTGVNFEQCNIAVDTPVTFKSSTSANPEGGVFYSTLATYVFAVKLVCDRDVSITAVPVHINSYAPALGRTADIFNMDTDYNNGCWAHPHTRATKPGRPFTSEQMCMGNNRFMDILHNPGRRTYTDLLTFIDRLMQWLSCVSVFDTFGTLLGPKITVCDQHDSLAQLHARDFGNILDGFDSMFRGERTGYRSMEMSVLFPENVRSALSLAWDDVTLEMNIDYFHRAYCLVLYNIILAFYENAVLSEGLAPRNSRGSMLGYGDKGFFSNALYTDMMLGLHVLRNVSTDMDKACTSHTRILNSDMSHIRETTWLGQLSFTSIEDEEEQYRRIYETLHSARLEFDRMCE